MKEKIKSGVSGKNLVVWVIILSLALLVLVFLIFSFGGTKKNRIVPPAAVTPGQVGIKANFCDGNDWKMVGALPVSDEQRIFLKQSLIRVAMESSALAGSPMVSSAAPIPDYMAYLDNFYQLNDNLSIPIFFGLKIADMAKNDFDNSAIIAFRLAVMQKLQVYGLIK